MAGTTPNEVRELLRNVPYPGTSRNIVSAGFVKEISVEGSTVTVTFTPNTTNAVKVGAMEDGIRDVLYGASFALVVVQTEAPYDDKSMLLGVGSMNPLQAEMLEDGVDPQPDVLLGDIGLTSKHLTPDGRVPGRVPPVAQPGSEPAGSGAPAGLGAPEVPDEPLGPQEPDYTGPLPVFQWEIDPTDPGAESVQRAVNHDGWEFRVWWQVHRGGELLYTSLQALREDWVDHAGIARRHPVGRTEAVNLVFDRGRGGIVAIYGTVRDFRPFVEAFRLAYEAEYLAVPAPRPADAARAEGVAP